MHLLFQVEFSREQQTGRLVIDGEEVATGLSQGTTKSINISPPFYVGGMPTEAAEAASGNLRVSHDHRSIALLSYHCSFLHLLASKEFKERSKQVFSFWKLLIPLKVSNCVKSQCSSQKVLYHLSSSVN